MVCEIAHFGNERTFLNTYSSDERECRVIALPQGFDINALCDAIASEARTVDFVCVDLAGVGAAIADRLKYMRVPNMLFCHARSAARTR